jgi:tetratricopeptide (TPR) repeat protein
MGYLTGIQACLNGEALISYDRGMPQEALNRLKEAADICRRISHKKGLSSALANIAAIRYRQGNVEKSLQLLVESEKICREIDYREGLAISIMGQAVIAAFKENRRESALQMAQNGYNMINTCGIRVLAKKMRDIQSSIEMDDQAIIADGIRQESPGPIMWVVKKQKLDKNS